VGPEVDARFEHSPELQLAGNGKYKLDLAQANRGQLETAGVPSAHIFDCGLCTACRPDQFFSYRREPQNPGRMLASICRLA
jgi:polyphenol oxidase